LNPQAMDTLRVGAGAAASHETRRAESGPFFGQQPPS